MNKEKKKNVVWTEERIIFLKEHYLIMKYKDLSKAMSTKEKTITEQAIKIFVLRHLQSKNIKWTDEKLKEIKLFVKEKKTDEEIATYFNCSLSILRSICNLRNIELNG